MRKIFHLHKLIGPSEPVRIYIYVTHQNFADGGHWPDMNFLFPGITTVCVNRSFLMFTYLNFDISWFHHHFVFSYM